MAFPSPSPSTATSSTTAIMACERDERRVIQARIDGVESDLTFTPAAGTVTRRSRDGHINVKVVLYDVLWTEIENSKFEFSSIRRKGKGKSELVHWHGQIDQGKLVDVRDWCDAIMSGAYAGTKRQRRLRVLVNPHSGKGLSRSTFRNVIEPVLKAARCKVDTTFTERAKHAYHICKRLPLNYDAVVTVSGDGLIHEAYNGFAEHEQPRRAFAIPIAPIPTGSGNGTALNLLGLDDGFDAVIAALNAVKGSPIKQDIISITLGEKRVYSFMSQTLGLMADLDINTEHLRWMGDKRFVYGFIRGVIAMKDCPIQLSVKVAEHDKRKMYQSLRSQRESESGKGKPDHDVLVDIEEVGADSMPALQHHDRTSEEDGWVTVTEPILFLYAGKSPYVARDLMQFPVAHASDGYVDVVAQKMTSRGKMLGLMDGAELGKPYWSDTQLYFKALAYRVTPLKPNVNFAIDGEVYPFETFQVEVHQGLARLLSPFGRYAADFNVPPPEERQLRVVRDGEGERSGAGGLRGVFSCCFPSGKQAEE